METYMECPDYARYGRQRCLGRDKEEWTSVFEVQDEEGYGQYVPKSYYDVRCANCPKLKKE